MRWWRERHLILAFAASPASAAFRHTTVAAEFGPDGTYATSFGTSNIGDIAYQRPNKRIYVQRAGLIYGFSVPSPGTYTPLGGAFPFPSAEATATPTWR